MRVLALILFLWGAIVLGIGIVAAMRDDDAAAGSFVVAPILIISAVTAWRSSKPAPPSDPPDVQRNG